MSHLQQSFSTICLPLGEVHSALSSYLVRVFVLAGNVLRTARVLVKAVQATPFTRPMFDITQYLIIKRVSHDSTVTVQLLHTAGRGCELHLWCDLV